jgi:hypothetical protein
MIEELILQVPYRATVLHGSFDYDRQSTHFYIPVMSIESNTVRSTECRPLKIVNRFNVPIVIFNISIDKSQLVSQYIQVK